MVAWSRRVFLSFLVALGAVVAPAHAAPTPDERARAHALNDLGFEAAKEERYREAARAFDQAWELDPHPDLLWNAARAWQKAGELTKARERYRRYLTHDDLPPDQRLQANDNLVIIDRALRERAERAGRRAGAALGRLEPRWTAWLGPPVGPAPSPAEPLPSESRARRAGWALVGTGAVLGGVGALFYALAADDRDDLAAFPDQVGADDLEAYHDTREDFLRDRALMWTSFGVAAAAVTGGVVALMLAPDDEAETRGTTGAIGVGPTRGGATVTGLWRF